MLWLAAAKMLCKLACKPIMKLIFRDLTPSASGDDFAIIYGDADNHYNYTDVVVDLNGAIENTTAVFKFANGEEMVGNVTNFGGDLEHGIGHGNFTVGEDSGQWITVDLTKGSAAAGELFEWLFMASKDGNVTAEEYSKALDMIKNEADGKHPMV